MLKSVSHSNAPTKFFELIASSKPRLVITPSLRAIVLAAAAPEGKVTFISMSVVRL